MRECNIVVATKATITGEAPNQILELTVTAPKTVLHGAIHKLVVNVDIPSGNLPVVLRYEDAVNTIPVLTRLSDTFKSNRLIRFRNILLRLSLDSVHYSAICTFPCDSNTLTIDPEVLAPYLPTTKTVKIGCGKIVPATEI